MNILKNNNNNNCILDESLNAPLCGGNKIRKLNYILKNQVYKGLLTYGSKYSNHCLAVAYYGAYFSIPVKLIILDDEKINISEYPNLRLAKKLGAELIIVKLDNAHGYIDKEIIKNTGFLWIPGGGHNRMGVDAYCDWFFEILNTNNSYSKYDWIALPFGTGTTSLGIAEAIKKNNCSMKVIGVSVSRTKNKCIDGCKDLVSDKVLANIKIDDRFAGQYGNIEKYHKKLQNEFLCDYGILPDPIYNIRVAQFLKEEKLSNGIILNTGGQLNNLLL